MSAVDQTIWMVPVDFQRDKLDADLKNLEKIYWPGNPNKLADETLKVHRQRMEDYKNHLEKTTDGR